MVRSTADEVLPRFVIPSAAEREESPAQVRRGSFAVFAAQDDTLDDVYTRLPMKYYRGWQFVPMKGNAAMYYETADDGSVTRFMTVIEGSGEIEKMPNPPMKRLFRPELLEEVSGEEFERWWATTR